MTLGTFQAVKFGALSHSFGRSEGNRTSQLLVFKLKGYRLLNCNIPIFEGLDNTFEMKLLSGRYFRTVFYYCTCS